MESYKSDKIVIDYGIDVIYSKLSDPRVFKAHLDANMDRLPAEAREHLEKVKFEDDGISILRAVKGRLPFLLLEEVDVNHMFVVLLSKLLGDIGLTTLADTHYNERLVARTVFPLL